jgi:spoIIIJ-associated protein
VKQEVIRKAPTTEEALDAALEELGVQQDAVEYEVLTEPGRKLFGLTGADKPAEVRVWLKEGFVAGIQRDAAEAPDDPGGDAGGQSAGEGAVPPLSEEELDKIADVGMGIIQGLLEHLGIEASVDEYEGEDDEIILDIVGADLGILIGRHGKTLDALQTLVTTMARRKLGEYHPILIDVEGYRSRRRVKLVDIAQNAAERAGRQGRDVRLQPMSSYERKVVHIALRNDPRVVTESEGDEPYRAVVISPK